MRKKFSMIHIAAAAVNAAAITGALILTMICSSAAESQSCNYAAQRWKGESKEQYTQLSCFLGNDAAFNKSGVKELKSNLLTKLEDVSIVAEQGKTLILDAFSADVGEKTLLCDSPKKAEADITAVSGDFFFFRNFRLVSGAFFDDSDLMHDGIVLDRKLAWQLYGGDDIIGMNIYINSVKLYVSGVIETPDTDEEKSCLGSTPKAYVSYDVADMLEGDGMDEFEGEPVNDSFDTVTCYECVMPDPVENFAYNALKDFFSDSCSGKYSIVNNSKRFDPKERARSFKKIEECAIKNNTVVYPFWENASRMVEVRLSILYGIRKYLFAVPVITLIWLAIKAFILYKRKKQGMKKALLRFVSDKWEKFRAHFRKNALHDPNKNAEI